MIDDKPAIAVLGPYEESHRDDLAATVASSLAASGYVVIASGLGHTATTVTRAVAAQGGRSCLILESSEAPDSGPAEHQTLLIRPGILQCTEAILDHADALVILDGDLQALAVLLQIWSFGTTVEGPFRPIILLGEAWPGIVKSLAAAANLDRRQRAMVTFATGVDEAVESLRYYIAP